MTVYLMRNATIILLCILISACSGDNNTARQSTSSEENQSDLLVNDAPDSNSDMADNGSSDSESDNSSQTVEDTQTSETTPESPQADVGDLNTTTSFATQCAGDAGRPGFMTTSPNCDPQWRVCRADDGLNSSNSWHTVDSDFYNGNQSHAGRICVKRCPNNADFIPDPAFPGLGWDNLKQTACAVAVESNDYDSVPVPLYLPDNTPLRETFVTPLAYFLYAGDAIWTCAVQHRQLSHDYFLNTGIFIELRFHDNSQLLHRLSTDSQWNDGYWGFDAFTGLKVLHVYGDSFSSTDGYTSNSINGNLRINQNRLEIYNTTVDRLACSTNRQHETTAEFPESIDEIESAPVITLAELRAMTLECNAFQRTTIHPQSAYYGAGHEIESTTDIPVRTISNVRAVEVDANLLYQDRFALDDSSVNYSYTDGSFSQRNQFANDVSRSPGNTIITFRRTSTAIIMTEHKHSGGGSGNSGDYTYTLSRCTVQ